jgi:hypothetical protein
MYRYASDKAMTPDKEMVTRPHFKAMRMYALFPLLGGFRYPRWVIG